jgi:hypothetical protein
MAPAALRVLLLGLGAAMAAASRVVPRFRAQVSRDLVVQLDTDDGVAHHFVFDKDTRTMASRPGPAPAPGLVLSFESSWLAIRSLLNPHATGAMVAGMQRDRVRVQGNPAVLLWFHGLTRVVAPIGPGPEPRRTAPHAFVAPDPTSRVADRITREPAVTELDRAWPNAWEQRSKLEMVKVAAGGELKP